MSNFNCILSGSAAPRQMSLWRSSYMICRALPLLMSGALISASHSASGEPKHHSLDDTAQVKASAGVTLAHLVTPSQRVIKITAVDFAEAWRARQLTEPELIDTPSERRATLGSLIELTLLSERAQELGYPERPLVRYLRDQAAVRSFLAEDFEERLQAHNLPQHYVEASVQQNIGIFRHPELRRGAHLLLKPREISKPMTAEQSATLKPLADRVNTDLRGDPITSSDELKQRVARYQSWVPAEYEVIFERLGRFALRGRFDPEFTADCFKITTPKTLTSPIRSPFGYHLVWIEEVIPPLHTSDAEIEQTVRAKILPAVRAHEWGQLMYDLSKRVEIR